MERRIIGETDHCGETDHRRDGSLRRDGSSARRIAERRIIGETDHCGERRIIGETDHCGETDHRRDGPFRLQPGERHYLKDLYSQVRDGSFRLGVLPHEGRVPRDDRDPGDDLWAQTFDWLAPEPSLAHLNADTKGDFLELTLAAAAQVLDCAEKSCSEPLMLPARRAAADRRCRAHVGGAAAGQPAPAESDFFTREIDGRRVSCKCGGAVFGQWRYTTWGGLLAAVGAHAC